MMLFTRIFKWLAIVFVTLNLIIWSLSSPITKYFLAPLLAEQGLYLSTDTSIRFNPFLTRLSINNLGLFDSETQKNTLRIKKFTLQLALHRLLFKQIKVQKFAIDDFYMQVEKSEKNMKVAGFVIDNNKDKATKPVTTSALPENKYQLNLPKLQLSNGNIEVIFAGQSQHIKIDDLIVKDTLASTTNIVSALTLTAYINQAKTLLNIQIEHKNKSTQITSNFSVSNFSLSHVPQVFLNKFPQITQLNGLVSINSEQIITLDDKAINITVDNANLTPENIQLGLKKADKSWKVNIADIHSKLTHLLVKIPFDPQTKTAVQFSFKKFNLMMNKPSQFIDHSFNKKLNTDIKRSIQIKSLTLGALSNVNAKAATPFELHAVSNEYATLDISGSLRPFSSTPTYQINAKLKELSLPALSPYIEQAAGFSLQSGQLDNQLTLSLTGDKMLGETKIVIKGLETSSINEDEVNLFDGATTMPLNMALNILKDDRGDIELDVPLSGSTSDPNFGLSSLFTLITQKAVLSATKTYAIKTFLPYANVISVALTAGDFLLKARFADLPYQAKQVKPNKKQYPYLNNFIKLMNKNKALNVKICAVAVRSDVDDSKQHLSKKAVISHLKKIANKRELAFKSYVLSHSKIDSGRLLLCAPQVELSKKAQPRIELSI